MFKSLFPACSARSSLFFPALTYIFLIASGCNSSVPEASSSAETGAAENQIPPNGHNSRISLDWNGTYAGMLPCADCDAVKTVVTLYNNETFSRKVTYIGRDGRTFEDEGAFEWSEDGGSISIDNIDGSRQKYLVGEGFLLHLDRKGERITGARSERYRLEKLHRDPLLEDREWNMLGGEGPEITGRQVPSLHFDGKKRRLSGNDGCNRINADYMLYADRGLQIGTIAATKMACPDAEGQEAFRKMLRSTRAYSLTDTLTLLDENGAPLALFLESDNE